jgi:hypothetical protein
MLCQYLAFKIISFVTPFSDEVPYKDLLLYLLQVFFSISGCFVCTSL